MAIKKKEGIQTIFICDNCDNEMYRTSPKYKNLTTIDGSFEEIESIHKRFNYSDGYYKCECGAKHRLIKLPKKEGDPLFINLGEMI